MRNRHHSAAFVQLMWQRFTILKTIAFYLIIFICFLFLCSFLL